MSSQITLGFFRMPPGPNSPGATGTPEGGKEATSLGDLKRQDRFQYYVPGDLSKVQARNVPKSFYNTPKVCPYKSSKLQIVTPSSDSLGKERFCKGDIMRTRQRELGGSVPSLFFKTVQCSKEKRRYQTHPRPLPSEQIVGGPQVQNGPHFKSGSLYQGGSLGNDIGPRGCIFSRKNLKKVPALLRLHPVGRGSRKTKGLCFPGSPIRSFDSSLVLQSGHKTNKARSKITRNSSALILGRLSKSRLPSSNFRKHKQDIISLRESGIPSKLGKVMSNSISKNCLFGGNFESRRSHTHTSHGQGSATLAVCPQSTGGRIPLKKGSRASRGFPKFCSRFSSTRKALLKANHSLAEPEYVGFHKGSTNPCGPSFKGSPSPVVGHSSPYKPSSNASPRSHYRNYDRRLEVWLERGSPSPPGAWNLGGGRKVTLHELDGAEDNSPGATRICGLLPGSVRSALHGQHNSLGLPKPSGFVSFCLPMVINQRDFGALSRERNSSSTGSHRRTSECASRQGLEVFADLNRMVFGQTLFSLGLQRTWSSSRGGSLCYKRECTAAFFCLPLPRSIGRRSGLLYSGLEQLEHNLPFPSNPLFGQGGSEAVVLQRSGDADSPSLAVSGLVPSSCSEVSEGDPAPFRSLSTPVDRQRPGMLPAHTVLEASRLDVVKNSLERQGYSKDSIRYILSRLKDSTDNRYQYVWTKFLEFLNINNINHNCISAKDVVNFLSYQASAFNKAYNTIGVYKCAIFTPLYYKFNINLRENIRVSDFMQGLFALNPPPKKFNTPKWDISLVLNFLKSPQFEPLDKVPWKQCIMKTLFLLMLSSGRRISDIAALTREVFYLDECVQIVWVDGFRAKNHRQDFIPMDPLIMELDSVVSSDLLLCPVRALNIYLERRSFLTRPDNDDMLWSVRQSTLSLYFKELINDAFRFNGNPAVDLPVSTHQCRKFAASLSKFYIKSSDEDLAAWMGVKNMSVLLKHYISRFPLVNVKCVVPLGTIGPT